MNIGVACRAIVAISALQAVAEDCAAHPGYPASAIVHVGAGGRIAIHVRHDALAFALNETPARIGDEPMLRALDGPRRELEAALNDARERFQEQLAIVADGQAVSFDVVATPAAAVLGAAARQGDQRVRLPMMLEFVVVAQLPAGARRFALRFPEMLDDVILTVHRPREEPFAMPLRAGERSPEFTSSTDEVERADAQDGSLSQLPFQKRPADVDSSPPLMSSLAIASRYVVLGITHIIPHGVDHMLFVLGLFFLSTRLGQLLWQVTAFTVAHSVTLALATLGVVRLSPAVIEPVIAASIAFVAVENLVTARVHPWRVLIVFAFGLVHGLGFAGALQDVGLPREQLAAAIVSFNVGVEIGQLGVIASALLVFGWWRTRRRYRTIVAIPASALIAFVGLWWTAQRVFGF